MFGKLRELFAACFDSWDEICLNENARLRTMNILFYLTIAVVSFAMSLLNYFTHTYNLLVVTALLCAVFGIFGILLLLKVNVLPVSTPIAAIGCWIMCAYFMYSGGTEGFSVVWVLLFPAFSHLITPRKVYRIFSLSLLLMVYVVLLTPVFDYLAYHYSDPFRYRFPVVITFVVACGWLSELVGHETQKRLDAITASLKRQAYTDTLTGIGNRRAFRVDYENLTFGSRHSFAIIDVDNFKNINDSCGHDAGDYVLKEIAEIISKGIRPLDKVYRWGGEEFLVVFDSMSIDLLSSALERLRVAVENNKFLHGGQRICDLTISAGGIAACEGLEVSACLKQADLCLYRAKNGGRNRAEIISGATL